MKPKQNFLDENCLETHLLEQLSWQSGIIDKELNGHKQPDLPILVGKNVWDYFLSMLSLDERPSGNRFQLITGTEVVYHEYLPEDMLVADKVYLLDKNVIPEMYLNNI